MEAWWTSYSLLFNEPAGTSRGVLYEKPTFFIKLKDEDGSTAFGEIPFFPGLSSESVEELTAGISGLDVDGIRSRSVLSSGISSLDFGLQQALFTLRGGGKACPSPFTEGCDSIVINGLIWMGSRERMMKRVKEKLKERFECIKIKIGAVAWDEELELIRYIRRESATDVTVRVDANGAFRSYDECMDKLNQLAALNVHSIEQPVRAGQPELMRKICDNSPVPVALDEELIGIPVGEKRTQLLEFIRPCYIILKPALCFGFLGASDWIDRAEATGIGWWITSALESSVGLDAIAQFTGRLVPKIPQGLGTGNLYVNNFASALSLQGDRLTYKGIDTPYREQLEQLRWKKI